ncbi:heparan-alpha-glucosaminide N-acetyltransferase [Salvia divinorum]|uniref:Heparan-alpha-glucosaminide N-acetyltransferase n=1 Tax=Salvia divinorum TaxID=28513 RepID=A0ABD1GZ04_SALDI
MEDSNKLEEGFGPQLASKNEQLEGERGAEDAAAHGVSIEAEIKIMTASEGQPLKSKRVATLDAFRGLTIVLMILVDDAGGAYARIDHSPWNGCTLADFVMPFFLFIVGVKRTPKVSFAIRKVIPRTLKVLFWGILLQGGYSHAPDDLSYGVDMKVIRWCGILQRIALVYFIVALIEILTTKIRPTTLKPSRAPQIRKILRKMWDERALCNAVGYVDRQVWGINHLYSDPVWKRLRACTFSSPSSGPLREDAPSWCRAPFEPEGLLSSISGIVSGTIGIHFKGHAERLKHWVCMAVVLIVVALILHFTDAIPINKQLYSFSYVCFTAGAAGIVFSAFYIVHTGIYK